MSIIDICNLESEVTSFNEDDLLIISKYQNDSNTYLSRNLKCGDILSLFNDMNDSLNDLDSRILLLENPYHTIYSYYYKNDSTSSAPWTAGKSNPYSTTLSVPPGIYNVYLRSGAGGAARYASSNAAHRGQTNGLNVWFTYDLSDKTSNTNISITVGSYVAGSVKPEGTSGTIEGTYNGGTGGNTIFGGITVTGSKGSGIGANAASSYIGTVTVDSSESERVSNLRSEQESGTDSSVRGGIVQIQPAS